MQSPPFRNPRLRSLVAFGLVASLVLGVAVDAASQPAPKPPKGAAPAPKPAAAPKAAAPKAGKKDPKKGAAAASASAPPPPPPPPADTAPPPIVVQPVVKKSAPPPPDPTSDQLAQLERLSKAVQDYEKDAREFRDAITTVVKHHYEMRRRRVLSALDREITTERAELKRARDEAIRRLEEFVARYSGPTAHPEHSPDAMFRLAALYEERASQEVPEAEQAAAIRPAIALYKRVIREFPKYDQTAAIYYYLGHALNNSSRGAEAQQVWRSLVCHNKFSYPVAVDSADPEKDLIVRKPQDHDEKYWDAWGQMHPEPIGLTAAKHKGPKKAAPPKLTAKDKKNDPKAAGKSGEAEPQSADEETVYRPIYGEDCVAIPQKLDPGKGPKFITELWWQIGEFHFEQQDVKAGPYNYNRAVTAYRLAMKSAPDRIKDQVYSVAQYKLSWTYYKQQRYEAAVKEFISLLKYVDEKEARTGDPGSDFRAEAYSYIAGSLTYVDFAGPAEDEPFIIRSDVLDTETKEGVAEQKMHIGLDRALDARFVPQGVQQPNGKIENPKWTIEILKALAREYKDLNQYANTTDTLEAILQKYPLHRDAPIIQDELAATYEERARFIASKSKQQEEMFATRALQARTNLANYVGNTPWVDANKDDPEAIQTAERLAKGGLRNAAAAHTNKARSFAQAGQASTDGGERRQQFEKALSEYKLAETAWEGYYRQDESAQDGYDTRFWIADARYWQVALMVSLDMPVPPDAYTRARSANADVRDSNEDDRYLEPAANNIVTLSEFALTEQYKLNAATSGTQGFPKLEELRKSGTGPEIKVDASPPPAQVLYAVQARDEYAARVPPQSDPFKNVPLFTFQAAQYFYVYGQFDEAEKRFNAIYKDQCKKTKWAYEAWKKLLQMASIKAEQTGDTARTRELTALEDSKETSCAASEEQRQADDAIRKGITQGGLFADAWKAFQEAQKMSDGPERSKQWKKAGDLYRAALEAAPERNEAPEAAINGAIAYKQIGDYDTAISMYRLFIDKYGDDKTLTKLEKGDDKDRAEYQKRRKSLGDAYDALASAYVLFFNYRAAAETADTISDIKRFDDPKRKEAARNAMVLYSNLGDRDKMNAARNRFLTFKPSAEDKAEADYIVASADLKGWDPTGADTDANKTARGKASAAMSGYFENHKRDSAAAKFTTIAAYWTAKMKVAGGANADEWWKNTIGAFKQYKGVNAKEAVGSQQGNMAAEAEFTMIDEEIRKNFDYDTGHHKYKGTVVDVLKKYNADAKDAEKYNARLKELVDANTYGSIEYVTAALARQGSLYDSLRTGLFNTREPALQLFAANEEKILKQLEESGNQDLMDKAAEKRDQRNQLWRSKRDSELGSADNIAVSRYTNAVAISRKYNIRSAPVNKALQRLAFFTDVLGDEKMRQYTTGIEGFTYSDGMFQKSRPGMVVEPDVPPLPPPLPVVVQ